MSAKSACSSCRWQSPWVEREAGARRLLRDHRARVHGEGEVAPELLLADLFSSSERWLARAAESVPPLFRAGTRHLFAGSSVPVADDPAAAARRFWPDVHLPYLSGPVLPAAGPRLTEGVLERVREVLRSDRPALTLPPGRGRALEVIESDPDHPLEWSLLSAAASTVAESWMSWPDPVPDDWELDLCGAVRVFPRRGARRCHVRVLMPPDPDLRWRDLRDGLEGWKSCQGRPSDEGHGLVEVRFGVEPWDLPRFAASLIQTALMIHGWAGLKLVRWTEPPDDEDTGHEPGEDGAEGGEQP